MKLIRISLAAILFASITLLFLDFSGGLHTWLGWMAKIQFLPAILALNIGIIVLLVLLTLLFGRIYCSVICPLGIFQDLVARIGKWGKKMPYSYSRAKNLLRYSILGVFVIAFIFSISSIISLLDPYAAYGRFAHYLFLPLYQWGNNLLALISERINSYAFYTAEVWIKSIPTLVVAALTLFVVAILAWKNGRTWCNTICPVGTLLGFLSPYALFKISIEEQKCNKCTLCERSCKASCIDSKGSHIDYSRCVACMNCIETCNQDALKYSFWRKSKTRTLPHKAHNGRKEFITTSLLLAATALKAQIIPKATDIKPDGGLADILKKVSPDRRTPLVPAGSSSLRRIKRHCTACQLCVTVCPNNILRPSTRLETFMQPFISYERGYCRPECVKCTEVCPSGAIKRITKEEKSSTKIGHAVWVRERCIPLRDFQECNNCAHHCPTQAITMVPSVVGDETSPKIPAINEELCIGCGACEYLCPSRPLSAIYVEGEHIHRIM